MDSRYREYAQLAINYSLQMKAGEKVLIRMNSESARFAEVVGEEVLRAGGLPVFQFGSARVGAVRLTEGTQEQAEFLHPAEAAAYECDCYIAIDAPAGFQPPKFQRELLAIRQRLMEELQERVDRMRWLVLLIPTPYLADRLGVSFEECEDLIFKATLGTDWNELEQRALAIKDMFDSGSEVRLVAPGTDLRFSLAGRVGIASVGRRNMPCGETFYAPITESVHGHVTFHDPQFAYTGKITGIRLEFRDGEVVQATAEDGQDRLDTLLATDEGARRIGEFGIGVNALVERMTGNILLDEKIAGTVHLALGNAYAECGGTNKSRLHWDMILDLRRDGEVYLDGLLVCLNGEWLTALPSMTKASA